MIKRGDVVYFVRWPDVELTACSEPEKYNEMTVVECKWLPRGRRASYEHALFDVHALSKEKPIITIHNE